MERTSERENIRENGENIRERENNRENGNRKVFSDEEWTVVTSRRRRGGRDGKGKTDGKTQVNSFYFTNFPDEVTLQELRHRFSRIGEVVNIFIPGKKNKQGKFFGFVRFKGIEDTKDTEERMRDIWFGSYKLWANVARFTKEGGFQNELGGKRHTLDGRNKETEIKRLKHNEAPVRSRKIGWDRTKVGNLSYAEAAGRKADGAGRQEVTVVEGYQCVLENNTKEKQVESREWRGLSFETVEEDRVWARKGLIGMVKNIDEVPLIQQKILDVGITTVKIIPMGGKKVFIQPLEDEDLWDLVKDAEEFYWFVNIKEWNPKEISSDRSIWIRVYGVPVHAWRENFFKRILECTGEVIVLDDDTLKKRRFDYARVLIRTSALSFINQVEKVKIDEDFFVVRLLEEVSFYPTRIAEKQSLQQVEDEESNSQWWINHNVEEEEEGEMNSQNLEREYCAFNEMWEEGKNDESGGANGKVQEKSLIPASPKKAAHSAIGVRERKENSPSTTQMGPHYATKDNFILDSTGVLFTGVLGPIKRPIREVHEVTGSGSGPGIMTQKNQVELIENSQRKYRKKQNPSTMNFV
jgi:hypothetical protein